MHWGFNSITNLRTELISPNSTSSFPISVYLFAFLSAYLSICTCERNCRVSHVHLLLSRFILETWWFHRRYSSKCPKCSFSWRPILKCVHLWRQQLLDKFRLLFLSFHLPSVCLCFSLSFSISVCLFGLLSICLSVISFKSAYNWEYHPYTYHCHGMETRTVNSSSLNILRGLFWMYAPTWICQPILATFHVSLSV